MVPTWYTQSNTFHAVTVCATRQEKQTGRCLVAQTRDQLNKSIRRDTEAVVENHPHLALGGR